MANPGELYCGIVSIPSQVPFKFVPDIKVILIPNALLGVSIPQVIDDIPLKSSVPPNKKVTFAEPFVTSTTCGVIDSEVISGGIVSWA